MSIDLSSPFEIAGKSVYLVPDIVNAEQPHNAQLDDDIVLLEHESDIHSNIWVMESTLRSIREQYPDFDVFGLWQTLIASGVAKNDVPLQLIKEDEDSGYYLICENGKAIDSGKYQSNTIFNANYNFNDGVEILFSSLDLKLAENKALLIKEKAKINSLLKRKTWIFRGGATAVIIVISVGVNFYLDYVHKEKVAEIRQLMSDVELAKEKLQALRKVKIDKYPLQSTHIEALSYLAARSNSMAVDDLNINEIAGEAKLYPFNEDVFLPKFYKQTRQPDGSIVVSWEATDNS